MSNENLICPICGKPTSVWYGNARKDKLCREHAQQLKEGLIEQCPDCGKWYETGKPCECKNKIAKHTENANLNELTCIICGEPSKGKHFCRVCYAKYKDRSVDIRITHCKDTEILDEYGNLQYKCDDGRKVRSRAEVIISNFLFKERIRAVYEETIYYKDDSGENKTLHPDFYLPDYEMYIEYNELTNKPYLKSKEYTQKIYSKLNKNVLIISDKDLRDIAACLKPALGLH